MQMEIAMLHPLTGELRKVPEGEVAMCETPQDAYRLCRKYSRVRRTDVVMAHLLLGHENSGHFSQLMNCDHNDRLRHMCPKLANKLQILCENTAIEQWTHMELRGQLFCQRAEALSEKESMRG